MNRVQILFSYLFLTLCLIVAQSGNALAQHQHHQMDNNPPAKTAAPTDQPSSTKPVEAEQHNDHNSVNTITPPQPANTDQHEDQSMPMNHDSGGKMDHPMPANQDQQMPAGHNMENMDHGNMPGNMNHDMSSITGGPFHSHLAIGSGTSLVPASSPGHMWMFMPGSWTIMLHGELKAGFNYQSGPRGVGKAESENYLMVMASHKLSSGELMLRGMFSAEPLTTPHGGFPQLFQVGETYHGRPIVDAQHPHDLFMELAMSYTVPLTDKVAVQFYGGPVAEPALGPTAFMHRASASENPTAPLGHHWQDSTHISHGVFTTSITAWRFKLEGSIFNAREPNEGRVGIEFAPMNSYSGRLWFTPNRNWTMQFSQGLLKRPEFHDPIDIRRTTASISYNREMQNGNWATSLIWGRNASIRGDSNAYLLESTVNFLTRNYLYSRIELADREGLQQENIFGKAGNEPPANLISNNQNEVLSNEFEPQFRIAAFTFGGVRDIVSTSQLNVGLGTDITFYHQPQALKTIYGNNPVGLHFFIRLRPGKMQH